MALKASVTDLAEVPEAFHSLYTQADGGFHLSVDGMVPKAKLDEFRNNNVALKKQVEDYTTKFDGVDPEKYRALTAKEQADRDKKLIDSGKVEELFAERLAPLKTDYEKRLKAEADAKLAMQSQLEGLLIDSAIRDAAAKSGVRPTAVDDVLLRGRQTFKLQDGKAIPMKPDGTPLYGKTSDPMTVAEWVSSLTEAAPHLFEQSTGGGSNKATGNTQVPAGAVSRNDSQAFLANLKGIASGKVKVR